MENNDPIKFVLDKKDRRLLFELDVNARQPNVRIAKKLRISKDSVKYRIERLEKKGIIKSFHTEIDPYRTGKFVFRILLRFHNVSVEKEREIIEYFVKDPEIAWIASAQGSWDLLVGVWVRNIFEFYNYEQRFLDLYGSYVERKRISIYYRMNIFKKNYLSDEVHTHGEYKYMGKQEYTKFDDIDLDILDILIANARMPVYRIANLLGVSSKVVAYRIQKLLKEDVILGFRPLIDLESIGYKWFKLHLTLQTTQKEKRKELFYFLSKMKNVVFIDDMIGGYDFEVDLNLKSTADLRVYIERVRNAFPEMIKDFETLELYKIYKY